MPALATEGERAEALRSFSEGIYAATMARASLHKLSTVSTALAKYGLALLPPEPEKVAALGAVIKETKPDGSVTVRVVHDGTNGVGLNQTIKVRDLCNLPMAPDLKRVLREAASSRKPHFGMKVDVKEAHRHIPINRRDWHRLACQVRRGGGQSLLQHGRDLRRVVGAVLVDTRRSIHAQASP